MTKQCTKPLNHTSHTLFVVTRLLVITDDWSSPIVFHFVLTTLVYSFSEWAVKNIWVKKPRYTVDAQYISVLCLAPHKNNRNCSKQMSVSLQGSRMYHLHFHPSTFQSLHHSALFEWHNKQHNQFTTGHGLYLGWWSSNINHNGLLGNTGTRSANKLHETWRCMVCQLQGAFKFSHLHFLLFV